MKYSFSLSCIILILLYETDITAATGPPVCKFKCRSQSNNLVKLEEGVTYLYNLEGNTETLVPKAKGPFGETVKLNLKAKVEVSVLPQCKTGIQLREVQITGPDGKVHLGQAKLEQNPLLVSLSGGKLDSEVCAVHDDDFASLNIKRAVASLLQANTGENGGNGFETDVFGACPTHFKVNKDADAVIVTKHRDLEKCQFRENIRQSLFSMPHGHATEIQSSPLLDSQFEVEQRIKNGILESATVKEEYLFTPFSNRDNGAKTKVITKMVLESKSPAAPPAFPNSEPRQIFFENPHETVICDIRTLLAALHRVADAPEGAVSHTAAKEFGSLVKLMRRASKPDLLSVYGNCKAGAGFPDRQLAKKVFIDALFQAGSADSVSAAVELLKSNEISEDKAKFWYLSFAFVRHTSGSALASAMTLLDNPKLPFEAYLGIGALAGHYCREHTCEGSPQIDQLFLKFTELVGTPAKIPRDRENYVIAALKGLKNVKYLNEETANKIVHVMKDNHVSARIRVAALETAQSDACKGKIPKGAADIFYNREEDSELRIKAYLVMVECPSPKMANKLSEFLETEPVNQVGAFVTSHLRNLRGSSNPDKENAREILYNVKPRKKFPFDIRKFSRNHEFSYKFDTLSTSAAAESNVIFSQKSYIPRSANLNLTVEFFGHAFNLFEFNARAENLEKIYERYFGPRGYVKTHKPMEIFKDARKLYHDVESRINDKYKNMISRGRRSVTRPDTNKFASKVKLHNSKLDYNIDVDLSMKVLGNELYWTNIEDAEAPLTPSGVIDKVASFVDNGLGRVKDYRADYKNHYQFLDTDIAYPTGNGFPLRLSAVGSGVVYMKIGTNFDVSAFMKDPKNGLAKFEFIPSASVDVSGEMGVDAYAVEAGVKLSGNLHTSTGSDITLKMLNGHGLDLHFGLPIKQSDVVTLNSEVFSFVREQGMPSTESLLEFNVPRKDYHGCFDQLQALVGLTFCGDVGFPNDQQSIVSTAAMYPLNGHSKLSFRLEKHDETLSTYHMRFFYDLTNPKNRRVEFKIDTPGTQQPREISFLAAVVTEPDKAVDIQFVSPLHKFVARGAIVDNDAEYSISGYAKIDDSQEYRAKLGLVSTGASYTPVLEYVPAGGPLSDVKVDGEVMVEKQPGNPRKKFIFRNVRLTSSKMTITADGTVLADPHMCETDLNIGYDQHTVGIKTEIHLPTSKYIKLGAQISPSQYPDFSFGFNYEYQRAEHHMENRLTFIHGKDLASTQNKLNIIQVVDYYYESTENFNYAMKNMISYPLLEIDVKIDGAVTRKTFNYDISGRYGKYHAKSKLDFKTFIKAKGDYDIDFAIGAFDKELTLQATRDIIDPSKTRYTQKLETKPGRSYDLAFEVNHHFANNEAKVTVIATSQNYPNYVLDAGITASQGNFDGHCKIHDGSKDVMVGTVKYVKNSPFNGNFKLFIENVVDSNGEIVCQEEKVTGALSIHFLKSNNVIKGTADLNKAGNKYTGLIEGSSVENQQLRWNFRVETDTDLTRRSINSKNKVIMSDKQLEFNFNGENTGKETDGTMNGGFDVTLPDGKYFTGSIKQGLHIIPRNIHGDLFLELGYSMQKGGPLTKYHLDTFVKSFDVKKYSVVTKFEIGREGDKGSFIFGNIFRSVPNEDRLIIDQETSLTGSLIKMPYESKAHILVSRPEVNFAVSSSFGEYRLKSDGKVLTGIVDKVRHWECNIEIDTPVESMRRMKFDSMVHFAQGDANKAHLLQFKVENHYNEKMINVNGEAELALNRGTIKGSMSLPGDARPSNVDISYSRSINNDLRNAQVSFTAHYDNDKSLVLNTIFNYRSDLDIMDMHVTGQTTLEKLKTIDFKLSHKKLTSTARNTDFSIAVNEEKAEGFAKIDFTPKQPMFDITVNHAAGKSRLFMKVNRKGDRQYTTEGQVAWTLNGAGQIDFSSNVEVESFDNFHILFRANSEKMNVNKFKFEVGNKSVKSGAAKKINFTAQTADKKGFSGAVTYAVKESETGFIVEGKGHIEFQSDKYPLTYKAQYKTLSKAAENEIGTSFTLNADFEKGNYVLEYKITDKELFYINKFCYNGKCGHAEMRNYLQILDYTEMKHDAYLLYQNNIQDRNDNFKIFSKTFRKGLKVDHETGLALEGRDYNMKYYVHEGEGGLVFLLPSREIAAIAVYDLPVDLVTGKLKSDIKHLVANFDGSLYLDRRNKPQERGNLLISGEFTASTKLISTKGEIKLSHPALHKDLLIRAKGSAGVEQQRVVDALVEIDIFNRKNQKISANLLVEHFRANDGHNVTGKIEITSKGLNLNVGSNAHLFANEHGVTAGSFFSYHDTKNVMKEMGALVEANPKRFFTLVKLPNRELLKIDSVIQSSSQQEVIDTEINLAELRYFTSRVEMNGFHSMKASIGRKDNPKRLELTANVSPMIVEFRADKMEGPNKNNLISILLTSKSNKETTPNFEINSQKIKECMSESKDDMRQLVQEVKTVLVDMSKESLEEYSSMIKSAKKVQPDFKPLIQHFQTEFDVIRKELDEDPQFQKFSSIYKTLFGGIIDAMEAYVNKLIAMSEKMSTEATEIQNKIVEAAKEFLTKMTESYEKLPEPFMGLVNQICDLGCAIVGYGLDFIKNHETEIKQVLFEVSGYIQEFAEFCTNSAETIKREAKDFYKVVLDQIKTMPIVTNFEEKFKEMTNYELPQAIKNFYSEFNFALEDIMKTPELKEFYDNFFAYLIKVPIPSFLVKLPKIGTFKEISLIRYIKTITEYPTISEFFHTYRPFLNFEDNIIPLKAYGIILNSHHFFTFDQKHFSFKGTCSYILAQDFLDGNFSVVANIDNGKIKSITLSDAKDTVEMFNDNTVSVNGNHGDYPVNHNDFSGWVRYGTFNMKHKSGVHITKYQRQDMFIFRISGFYFGKTRGLLGTISNEHYDDYTLPNGHIAKDATEFANSYKVMDSCPAATEMPPASGHAPECTKLFFTDSELKSGFNYINHEIYREACDQHIGWVQSDKLAAACDVAAAYVLALKQAYMTFAALPDECVQCNINGQPMGIGQNVDVQSPQGKADVIIVFEQTAYNGPVFRELVTPLIASLSHDLKEKGLGDVEFALIGYGGPNMEWPQHFGNNGKITYEGKADKIKFKETDESKPSKGTLLQTLLALNTFEKKLNFIVDYINLELGHEPIVMAMQEANIYPFRQGAAKIILLVNSQNCPLSPTFPLSLQIPRMLRIRKYYNDLGLQFHFITPMTTTKIANKPENELKNLVGFDAEKMYYFADAKKNPIEGDASDRGHLIYDNDLCLSFSQYIGGAAFNSNVFTHAKPEQQKKFVHVVSRRIAQGAVKHRYTESCSCKLYHGLFAYPECRVTEKV